MISKPLVFVLVAAGSVAAAAGGGYLAVRQNAAEQPVAATSAVPVLPASVEPVTETEALVEPAEPEPVVETPVAEPPPTPVRPAPAAPRAQARRAAEPTARPSRSAAPDTARAPVTSEPTSWPVENPGPVARTAPPGESAVGSPDRSVYEPIPNVPPVPPVPQFEELVVPAASVLGLQVETALSSERARVEDRVEARVTRDVLTDGRVAIPAGSRVLGSVTLVEPGGKMKDRARLGVRFHTLVFADGTQLPLRTDPIFREGESPSSESARKIGGAAVGGAILGAIIGGGKGAAIGGATGAAGGTAVVMAGDRNAATLPAGTVVTVRLTAPVSVEVEKR